MFFCLSVCRLMLNEHDCNYNMVVKSRECGAGVSILSLLLGADEIAYFGDRRSCAVRLPNPAIIKTAADNSMPKSQEIISEVSVLKYPGEHALKFT